MPNLQGHVCNIIILFSREISFFFSVIEMYDKPNIFEYITIF